jgi:hypothetical protein
MRQGGHNPPLFVRSFGRWRLAIADRLGDLVLFGLPDAPGLIARLVVPSSATPRAAYGRILRGNRPNGVYRGLDGVA